MRLVISAFTVLLWVLSGCSESEPSNHSPASDLTAPSTAGETLNLNVGEIPDELPAFKSLLSKYVNVFGVHIFSTASTPDEKVVHAAHVMAQYLDNDADGVVDDPSVLAAMLEAQAFMIMAKDENELEMLDPEPLEEAGYFAGQGLFGTETNPSDGFDASLEEVLHLISDYGYAIAHESQFGVQPGSSMTTAMDTARGGQFIETSEDDCDGGGNCALPTEGYPEGAWYTYDDDTCSYRCMATEYFYWVLSSILGAQSVRCGEISHEWSPCTPEAVQNQDTTAYSLFTDTNAGYHMPTNLPDGNYQGPLQ